MLLRLTLCAFLATTVVAVKDCPKGQRKCPDTPICVNVQKDPGHCGNCNTSCPKGNICSGGVCMPGSGPDCRPGVKLFNNECFQIECGFFNSGDPVGSTTAANVVACSRACANTQNCIYAIFNRDGSGACQLLDATTGGDKKNPGYDLGRLTLRDQCG